MNRRSTLALLLLGAGAVFPFVAPSAHADTVEQAWWNLANAGAAPPPNPPDVGKTDLLIQFGDTTGAYSGISNQQGTGASAITAVAFTLPDGAVPQRLTLQVSDNAVAQHVMACPIEGSFKAERNGHYKDVPTYDCAHQVVGTYDSKAHTLTFTGVADVAGPTALSVVLLPGQADRVVVHQVTSADLSVTGGEEQLPAFVPPPVVSQPATTTVPQPAPATVPNAAALPTPAPVVPTQPEPVVAPSMPQLQKPLAETDADTARVKLLAGSELAILAAVVLLYATPLGRRLLPATVEPAGMRGVGRFRAERVGQPPRL